MNFLFFKKENKEVITMLSKIESEISEKSKIVKRI